MKHGSFKYRAALIETRDDSSRHITINHVGHISFLLSLTWIFFMKTYCPLKIHWRGTERSKQVRLLQNKVKRVAKELQARWYEVSLGRWKWKTHQCSLKLAGAVRKAEPTWTFHTYQDSPISQKHHINPHWAERKGCPYQQVLYPKPLATSLVKPFNCW